jgi:hypothetical protein
MADVVIVQPAPPSYVIVAATQGPGGAATVAVTGTGFLHATGGTLDPAARAVNLASADVTGTLGVSNGGTGLTATGAVGTFLKTVSTGVLGFALLAAADLPTITLTGDVVGANAGGSIATQVQGIRGVSVPTPPGAGTTVLTDVSGVLSWTAPTLASVTGTGLWYSAGGALNAAAVTLAGDVTQGALSGSNVPLTVTGLQAKALPSLTAGVLQYSGSAWSLAAVAAASIAPGTSGQILQSNATPATVWVTVTGDTTIGATGVTTTAKINGTSVPAGGALTTGNQLIVSGASSATWQSLNLAGGANFVTGNLPIGNIAPGTSAQVLMSNGTPATTWTTLSGDTTVGATGITTTGKINGASVPAAGALTTGNVLQVTGVSALSYAAVNLAGGANFVTGTLPVGNLPSLSGDVTGAINANTVGKIQGNTVTSGALTKGQFFVATTTSNWAATTLSGDISESATTAGLLTVTQWQAGVGVFDTAGTVTWASTASPQLRQTSTASAAGATLSIFPQQSSNTNATGGSVNIQLQTPTGTGTEAAFQVSRGGTQIFNVSDLAGSSGGYTAAYFSTNTGNNYAFLGDAANTFTAISGPANLYLAVTGNTKVSITANGVQFFDGTSQVLGGGAGVIGISAATTVPSSNPASGGSILYAAGTTFGNGFNSLSCRGSAGAVTNMASQGSAQTINTQTQGYDLAWGTCRSVSSATAQTALSYATTTGVSGIAWIYVTAHAVTAGSGVAAGDSAGSTYLVGWRNIAGTVTLWMSGVVAVLGSATTTTATALTPPALSATVSTNAIAFKVANVALCTIDSEIYMEAVLN